ncbi:MAG TPA: DUF5700 domain-containing putative Zn-dependent protease [Verrucomicrobiae bacterium]|jgi:hypothetical protein|nr:DUF5700 domain-containing putative Zn-dependent protease [Verrucomicrobiae bacterium]
MILSALLGLFLAAVPAPDQVQVRLVTDEADAVLAILDRREAGTPIADADWQRLFTSDGYRRLKRREESMKRAFTDDDFKKFVLSNDLQQRAPKLRQALKTWAQAKLDEPARLALAYLPNDAYIHASVYIEIKPLTNSFVFEVATDPAVILYLDPEVPREKFENTVAHELHHIGYGTCCPSKGDKDLQSKLPERAQTVANWSGAFGEGFAMLAAAGGKDTHPHAVSPQADRERWDRDVADFNKNQQELDQFFRKVLSGELNKDQATKQGYSYFGIQGPWYTVGWKMAVTIEEVYGRPRLVKAMCSTSTLFATYNDAASELSRARNVHLPQWSPEIIQAMAPLQHNASF